MQDRKNTLPFQKKPKSLHFKFLITFISAMLVITIFIGGISIFEVDNYIQRQTENLVDTTCAYEATQINSIFDDMEKSVKIMERYVLSLLKSRSDITTAGKQEEITQAANQMFLDIAQQTGTAIAYYLRYNPEIADSKGGLYYGKTDSGEYVRLETTDLSLYEKNDTEHVGWFWQPYAAGKPTWMMPYYNQNHEILMISYVIPLYYDDLFVGVIGMDFDYAYLSDQVHQIKIYENGVAHLEIDGKVIHHEKDTTHTHIPDNKDEYLNVSEELINGMTLVLSASYDDIRQIRYEIVCKIVFATLLLAFFFSLIIVFVVNKTVEPLKKLTAAATQLSNRDYDVDIVHSNTHEIKLLSTAFENMANCLREHEKLQHLLAYRDSLTGLRNTTSYNAWVAEFNQEIESKDVSFGIIVFDMNYLKETNDRYGHDVGNKLIAAAARLISDTFKRSPVFRIGGDEFLVILQNRDLEECEALLAKFEAECNNAFAETDGKKIPVSVAKGFTLYDPQKDSHFVDVFNRADDAMYENKRSMKMNPRNITLAQGEQA